MHIFSLEFFGVAFTILGALIMSQGYKLMKNYLYFTFSCFLVANMFMLIVATEHGLVPMIIQVLIFWYLAFKGLKEYSENKSRDIVVAIGLFVTVILIILIEPKNTAIFTMKLLDTVAAGIAITGSYFLISRNGQTRQKAYMLFFVADAMYIYIGYSNQMYWFAGQSTLFLWTSISAYLNTKKEFAHG